ncbi:MAG: hypothetical protein AAGA77_18550, partial [Bacteroidota bacterium]
MKISSKFLLAITSLIFLQLACKPKETAALEVETQVVERTNIIDTKASSIVSTMIEAMGGYENWDDLKYVSWTFFGARHLVWDKKGGRVRIESPRDTMIYLIDLHNSNGRILKSGKEITETEEIKKLTDRGEGIWINDSYWLFMPFKLQDPGVTVTYVREDTMMGGAPSSVLSLTFKGVGNTPNNKYEVYVDKKDNLIKQWAFFKTADQETPPRVWPWDNYQSFNGMMLSTERSDKSGPSNIRIYE